MRYRMPCVRCGGEVLCPKCDGVMKTGEAVGVVATLTAELERWKVAGVGAKNEIATLHGELEGQTKAMRELEAKLNENHLDRERREALDCLGRESARIAAITAELQEFKEQYRGLEDQRDKLLTRNAALQDTNLMLAIERERYKNALEEIVSMQHMSTGKWAREIAEAALKQD
jgi:chromosome segregation ATPase